MLKSIKLAIAAVVVAVATTSGTISGASATEKTKTCYGVTNSGGQIVRYHYPCNRQPRKITPAKNLPTTSSQRTYSPIQTVRYLYPRNRQSQKFTPYNRALPYNRTIQHKRRYSPNRSTTQIRYKYPTPRATR